MNEFDFIKRIRERAQRRGPATGLVRGIGDDAAVITSSPDSDVVVTVDLLVEDIDFHREAMPPRLLGHKALAVSLSDIAAMGARPRWALVSIGIPREMWNSDFLDSLYGGIFELADRYSVRIIGGDTSRTPEKIVIDVVVLAECEHSRALSRAGAQPGDQIFVTGSLGGAAAGLRLLERGARWGTPNSSNADAPAIQIIIARHLRPEPRVGWGLVLGEERLASASIDISDGLSSDLNHICEEGGVGALIESARIPIDRSVAELCGRRALDPLMLALHGGEDFELLFTVSPQNVSRLPKKVDGVPLTRIGEIKEAAHGVSIAEASRVWELKPGGWEHFPG